jgi:hypothetical protein
MRELRERAEPILRIVVLILAGLVVYQLAGMVIRWNPFRSVTVPQLPALAISTNSSTGSMHGTKVTTAVKGTNNALPVAGTNTTTTVTNAVTNSISQIKTALNGTNSVATTNLVAVETNTATNVVASSETRISETNSALSTNAADKGTNLLLLASATTNAVPSVTGTNTNSAAHVQTEMTKTNAETSLIARPEMKSSGTNAALATNSMDKGTNVLAAKTGTGTNAVSGSKPEKKNVPGMPPEMAGGNFNPFGPPGKSNIELPATVKSRISKITDSEILGPVMHPLPMGLLGIAGNVAFLRSASGQTGLVKTGDSLDDIKLLRIGVNRVLIELNGQKQELMIFDGYGGESLLPNNSTNENNHP